MIYLIIEAWVLCGVITLMWVEDMAEKCKSKVPLSTRWVLASSGFVSLGLVLWAYLYVITAEILGDDI